MGVASLVNLMTYYSNKLPLEIWPFHDHRATRGLRAISSIPRFRALCSGGGNARYFGPVEGLFCLRPSLCGNAPTLRGCSVFNFLPMGKKLREPKTSQ